MTYVGNEEIPLYLSNKTVDQKIFSLKKKFNLIYQDKNL